ncbi:hypothetical protein [Bacillus arachidis]|uniref:hypothetical protein n=1 Tax=Bacillus arachidis TaxID=2819290 RepID=UPI00255CDE38|nr:hypothetical protein [Bacillus arachidis]WIY58991.1 hypothetical protein QRY57_01525 [Bacillus arachidis]
MEDCPKVDFEEIIVKFSPKINKSLRNTPIQEREDLEQEIMMKIYEKIPFLQNMSAPTFFDFIEKN